MSSNTGKSAEDKAVYAQPRRGSWYWALWTVPLVALVIASYWVYRSTLGGGEVIHINFEDGSGLRANQSALRYRGIQAGLVHDVSYTADGGRVLVVVKLNKGAEFLARDGSAFWIVTPEVSAGGVSGLGAIVSGSFIEAVAGSSAKPSHEFEGLAERPRLDPDGLDLQLSTERIDTLHEGAGVEFRGFTVGEVTDVELAEDGDRVLVDLHINSDYKHFVSTTSVFWTPAAFDFRFSLFGESKLRAPSLGTVLRGTIAFTNSQKEPGEPVKDGHHFPLYAEPPEEWSKEQEKLEELSLRPGISY